MEKTSEEIVQLYREGLAFVEFIPTVFREFCSLPLTEAVSPGRAETQLGHFTLNYLDR